MTITAETLIADYDAMTTIEDHAARTAQIEQLYQHKDAYRDQWLARELSDAEQVSVDDLRDHVVAYVHTEGGVDPTTYLTNLLTELFGRPGLPLETEAVRASLYLGASWSILLAYARNIAGPDVLRHETHASYSHYNRLGNGIDEPLDNDDPSSPIATDADIRAARQMFYSDFAQAFVTLVRKHRGLV